jgi:hypothetical protein
VSTDAASSSPASAVQPNNRLEAPLLDQRRGIACDAVGGLAGFARVAVLTRREANCGRKDRYFTRDNSLNIGRYIEMMITPTIAPTPIIIRGSMIAVSDEMAVSTSSS